MVKCSINETRISYLQQKLGYSFSDLSLLLRALTHSSYINEIGGERHESNERLEFLGDSLLGMTIAALLYNREQIMTEGEMTKLRSRMVCEETLCELAHDLDLGSCLLLGHGEDSGGGRQRPSILADAFEAVIAAVYLDGGIGQAMQLIEEKFRPYLDIPMAGRSDYKTILQEITQNRGMTHIYKLVSETGPDHDKTFTVKVYINGKPKGTGTGKSKKAAQQAAAKEAIIILEGDM